MRTKKLILFALAIFMMGISACNNEPDKPPIDEREVVNFGIASLQELIEKSEEINKLGANAMLVVNVYVTNDIQVNISNVNELTRFGGFRQHENISVRWQENSDVNLRTVIIGTQVVPIGAVPITLAQVNDEFGGVPLGGGATEDDTFVVPTDEADEFVEQGILSNEDITTPETISRIVVNNAVELDIWLTAFFEIQRNGNAVTFVFNEPLHNEMRGLRVRNSDHIQTLLNVRQNPNIIIQNPYITPSEENVHTTADDILLLADAFTIAHNGRFNVCPETERPNLFHITQANGAEQLMGIYAEITNGGAFATDIVNFGLTGEYLKYVVPNVLNLNQDGYASGKLNLRDLRNRRVNVTHNYHLLRVHTDETLEMLTFPGINGAVMSDGSAPIFHYNTAPRLTTHRGITDVWSNEDFSNAAAITHYQFGYGTRSGDKMLLSRSTGGNVFPKSQATYQIATFPPVATLHPIYEFLATFMSSYHYGRHIVGPRPISVINYYGVTIVMGNTPISDASRTMLINDLRRRAGDNVYSKYIDYITILSVGQAQAQGIYAGAWRGWQ